MNTKGQNIVEYILLVSVVIFILIVFLRHDRNAPMEKALVNSLESFDKTINAIDKEIGLDGRKPVPLHNKYN